MLFWSVFVAHPWLALVPGGIFLTIWIVRFSGPGGTTLQRIIGALPVAAWTFYAIYEWRMQAWSATVVAPIRIDLLLIIPVIAGVSFIGVVALARGKASV